MKTTAFVALFDSVTARSFHRLRSPAITVRHSLAAFNFSGYAEANIDLEFDQASQRLVARARVFNVSLNGTAGIGSSVIAKLVQSSIDKKINPIEIIRMDKLSFLLPIQNGANLRMKATGVRHEIDNGTLKIHIAYEFLKA